MKKQIKGTVKGLKMQRISPRGTGKSYAFKSNRLKAAYNEYARLPMPKVNERHMFDRSKHQLETEAIRGQISMVARKYGVTFKELDTYIEEKSKGTV